MDLANASGVKLPKELDYLPQTPYPDWAEQARVQGATTGRVADRIPRLGRADPQQLILQGVSLGGMSITWGEVEQTFVLMSVIKPFLLLYLLEQYGPDLVLQWVGTQPSDAPFNCAQQLQADGGHPRNPMINSGAIALADRLPGNSGEARAQAVLDWLNHQAGTALSLDRAMLASVHEAGRDPNLALVQLLQQAGAVSTPDTALDAYERLCCFSGRIEDLAALGLLLAGRNPTLTLHHRQIVNALLLTCGLYERSGPLAVQIGLPIKSGISGALLAVVPGQGAIACYGPALDTFGNSVAGLAFVDRCAHNLHLSIFT